MEAEEHQARHGADVQQQAAHQQEAHRAGQAAGDRDHDRLFPSRQVFGGYTAGERQLPGRTRWLAQGLPTTSWPSTASCGASADGSASASALPRVSAGPPGVRLPRRSVSRVATGSV